MGELYSLATRSAVKQFVADTDRAIRTGQLAPGGSFSLPEAAEKLSVRWPALRDQLAPLERAGLLSVGALGTATVAPLDIEELESVARLIRVLRPELDARASAHRAPEAAQRIRAVLIPSSLLAGECLTDDDWDSTVDAGFELWRGAISEVEIAQVRLLLSALRRYQRLGAEHLLVDIELTGVFVRETCAALEGILSTDPDVAFTHSMRVVDRIHELARLSLAGAEADASTSRTFAGRRPLFRLM